MRRVLILLTLLTGLAACASGNDLDEAPVALGNFALGHNVAVAVDPKSSALSRKVENEVLTDAMKAAVDARFGRYDGDDLHHISVVIDQYELAPPGVPVVASPRSGMVIRVTVWRDAIGAKLNEEPHQIIVIESTSGKTLFGSGLTQSKEQQVESLARSAAKQIELWFVKQMEAEGWFKGEDDATGEDATDVPAAEDA
ncbi:hypothetical protein [Pseudaestuariivita atlantica]|uniref:Lipoprotein n=1 Tax=Pseudaestuariivita atlantica TaxID=1317121 RepID=A0A0L1JN91_9RHOB|nr:hypothetical protein [Pseudaestuariivita atlantica]KNG93177.1 hypothetical protein ATO11_11995 [Pseudaestuariivita atlantica]